MKNEEKKTIKLPKELSLAVDYSHTCETCWYMDGGKGGQILDQKGNEENKDGGDDTQHQKEGRADGKSRNEVRVRLFPCKKLFKHRVKALDRGKENKGEKNAVKNRRDRRKEGAEAIQNISEIQADHGEQEGKGEHAQNVHGNGKILLV